MKIAKFKNFEELKLKKTFMSKVKGGTSTTIYQEVGVWETEYEDLNGNGELDDDEVKNGKLVNL